MTEKWDCYSPVALVLWRAADFAEAGFTSPCMHAAREINRTDAWFEAAYYSDRLYLIKPRTIFPLPPAAWAVALRQLAEFGPAGRPR